MKQIVESLQNASINDTYRYQFISPNATNLQKCFIPYTAFKTLNIFVGDTVLITTQKSKYISKVYANVLKSHYVKFCPTISINANNKLVSPEKCFLEKIESKKKLLNIEIEIVCEKSYSEPNALDFIAFVAKKLITGLTVISKSVISLENLNKFVKQDIIKIIVVNSNSMSYGEINNKTRISVLRLLSKTQYNQECLSESTLFFGMTTYLKEITDIIDAAACHVKTPNLFVPVKQVLLAGSTGCGKTSLIEEACRLKMCTLLKVLGQVVYGKEPGEAENNLSRIFQEAFCYSEINEICLVLIEDIEIMCPSKNSSQHIVRFSSYLMQLLEQSYNKAGVVVVATTNYPSDVNMALRRQGRFGKEIYLGKPSELQRRELISYFIKKNSKGKCSFHSEVGHAVANITQGYVVADLKYLCQIVSEKANSIQLWSNMDHILLEFKATLSTMKPASLRNEVEIVPAGLTMQEIGGMEYIKRQIELIINCAFVYSDNLRKLGLNKPKGLLLYGPPGCAKTTLVKGLASKGGITVISANSASIYSPFVGEAERAIVRLFETARQNAPSIIFLDEIDSLVGTRSHSNSSNVQERVLAALLIEMDGIGVTMKVADYTKRTSDGDDILVIGATNRPAQIDPALLRPGRLDRHVYVPPPDYEDRLQILNILTSKTPLHINVDLDDIARKTEYYTGADLKNLHTEAVLHAMRDNVDVLSVTKEDYDYTLKISKPTLNSCSILKYNKIDFN